MVETEKMDLTSANIADEQRQKLKELFPEIFTEGAKIDFERLKLTLGEMVDPGKERFGMNWPGKADCFKIIQQPSIATLTPSREESIAFDTTENLFIEGDNLEVLKLLQKSYFGKIKMIYIDPPYNTGNDFIYPDNYSESLDTYLRYTGQIDDEGRKYSTNTEADGRFHSKWMNMMYPRLFLARNLLKEDGVIFTSIDDKEVNNLRALMNEVFGEDNFVAQITWKSRKYPDARAKTGVSTDHEYILIYNRSDFGRLRGIERDETKFSNPDNDRRGPWMSRSLLGLATKQQRPNLHYAIKDPEKGNIFEPPADTGWRYAKDRMEELIATNCILFPSKPDGRPREKKFRSDMQSEMIAFPTIVDDTFTADGTVEIRNLFGGELFDFSKPSNLIKKLLVQGADKDAVVLDFFSGSSSTAHATFDLNKEDRGSRKFIMVQLPEPTDENSEAYKAGFKTIADIGKERIRRVIKKIQAEHEEKKDLFSGNKPALDLGFKVFKLQPSNFKLWDGEVAKDKDSIEGQLALFVEHINPKSSQEDILYEILLKSGFPLSTKIEKIKLAKKTVFSLADGSMFICLEKELTPEVIKAMAE
ncbi:MAG TPA: site-specific DNA-methyltransferase, partial [Candidatus Syntrophosphaera sp.]|nr:site-specific DNA-methyltransferase [Candidatus Syntrophosphaera sp.]